MEFKSNIPIYLQVIHDIKARIICGELPPGSKLPSSRELAVKYGINPNTAARIYNELEAAGISYTKRGIGTFINETPTLVDELKKEFLEDAFTDFTERVSSLGYSKDDIVKLLVEFYSNN